VSALHGALGGMIIRKGESYEASDNFGGFFRKYETLEEPAWFMVAGPIICSQKPPLSKLRPVADIGGGSNPYGWPISYSSARYYPQDGYPPEMIVQPAPVSLGCAFVYPQWFRREAISLALTIAKSPGL